MAVKFKKYEDPWKHGTMVGDPNREVRPLNLKGRQPLKEDGQNSPVCANSQP